MPNWKKVIVSGSDAILNEVTASSGLDTTDVTIDGWGSVSASLASISSTGTTQDLQDITDNGNTTTNVITASKFLGDKFNIGDNNSSQSTNFGYGSADNYGGTDVAGPTVFGYNALLNAQTFDAGVAIGHSAGKFLSATLNQLHSNTFVGGYAARNGEEARSTTAIGTSALQNFSGSYSSIAIGHNALVGAGGGDTGNSIITNTIAIGVSAGFHQSSPSNTIIIGNSAGNINNYPGSGNVNDGSDNSIYIGHEAVSKNKNRTNEIVIGYQATGSGNNSVTIGNSNTLNNYFFGNVSGSDVTIDDWGSVSSSLSSISATLGPGTISGRSLGSDLENLNADGVTLDFNFTGSSYNGSTELTLSVITGSIVSGNTALATGDQIVTYVDSITSSIDLQEVTDNGSTTTNNITIDSTGDARLVLDRAANSNDSEIEFKTNGTTNWSIGTGQVGNDTEFTFKGEGGSNYIRINQSGQADFLSAVTSSDVSIDDWGSVSASLASIESTSTSQTLQQVTDNGSTTTNSITISNTASIDYLEVNDRLQGNGSGFQFFAYNEDTVKTKFANWYSSNDRQYGMGQLWFETWFAAIDNQAQGDNRRIGFYLEEPNSGSSDADGGTGGHPTNSRFHVDVYGAYLSGSLNVESSISGSDVTIDDWGSISASLASINSTASSVTLQEVLDASNGTATASGSIYLTSSAASLDFEYTVLHAGTVVAEGGSGLFSTPNTSAPSSHFTTALTMGSPHSASVASSLKSNPGFNTNYRGQKRQLFPSDYVSAASQSMYVEYAEGANQNDNGTAYFQVDLDTNSPEYLLPLTASKLYVKAGGPTSPAPLTVEENIVISSSGTHGGILSFSDLTHMASDKNTINSGGSTAIQTYSLANYIGVKQDYVVYLGTRDGGGNITHRAGTFTATWDESGNISYSETTTTDNQNGSGIPSTSGLSIFAEVGVGNTAQISVENTTGYTATLISQTTAFKAPY